MADKKKDWKAVVVYSYSDEDAFQEDAIWEHIVRDMTDDEIVDYLETEDDKGYSLGFKDVQSAAFSLQND